MDPFLLEVQWPRSILAYLPLAWRHLRWMFSSWKKRKVLWSQRRCYSYLLSCAWDDKHWEAFIPALFSRMSLHKDEQWSSTFGELWCFSEPQDFLFFLLRFLKHPGRGYGSCTSHKKKKIWCSVEVVLLKTGIRLNPVNESKKSSGDCYHLIHALCKCFLLSLIFHCCYINCNCPILHTAHTGLIDSLCHQKKMCEMGNHQGDGWECCCLISAYSHLLSNTDRGITSLLLRVKLHLYALVIREAVIKLIHLTCWIFHTYAVLLWCLWSTFTDQQRSCSDEEKGLHSSEWGTVNVCSWNNTFSRSQFLWLKGNRVYFLFPALLSRWWCAAVNCYKLCKRNKTHSEVKGKFLL